MSSKKWIKVEIHRDSVEQLDELVAEGKFSSRQYAVNYIVKKYLEDKKVISLDLLEEYLEPMIDRILEKKKG